MGVFVVLLLVVLLLFGWLVGLICFLFLLVSVCFVRFFLDSSGVISDIKS